jgi:hypothetical protein
MRSERLAALAGLLLAALAAGCAPVSGASHVIDRSHLVNELASRLDKASTQTYTAEYELADKEHATVAQAQAPVRAAYTYASGKIATTLEATIDCRSGGDKLVCSVAPPQKPTSDTAIVFDAMREHGLVPPQRVIGLLTTASLAKTPAIRTSEQVIAGEEATCVDVSGLSGAATDRFHACITDSGVLGSFDGTLDGQPADTTLVRYAAQVADDAFDAPDGAELVDSRPTTRP